MIVLAVINALLIGSFYFVDPHADMLLIVLNVIANFVVGPTPAIIWSMYADTADYGEWKFGRRTTGLVFSASVFSQKVGLALGTGGLGWMLAYFGYVANAAQGPRAVSGILLLFSLVPATLALLGAFAIFFYPITDVRMKEIEAELAVRKAAA
jgi:GPH family glycoside/pentoside/hexuronide:cation symporter